MLKADDRLDLDDTMVIAHCKRKGACLMNEDWFSENNSIHHHINLHGRPTKSNHVLRDKLARDNSRQNRIKTNQQRYLPNNFHTAMVESRHVIRAQAQALGTESVLMHVVDGRIEMRMRVDPAMIKTDESNFPTYENKRITWSKTRISLQGVGECKVAQPITRAFQTPVTTRC